MITLDINSVANDYAELYEQPVGTVIKVDYDNYETVMERISENTPAGKSFEVYPINPGTDLYTMYGPNHCIITKNESLTA